MFINKLRILNFRNILDKDFKFENKVNIFYGENGVGKTSILEAINYISSGKSFRKGNYKDFINYKSNEFTIYLGYNKDDLENSISVRKDKKGQWKAKKNNTNISQQSTLTESLPVISIDPEVYRLVDSSPQYRRSFIDWLVFHVKHDYLLLWKKTHKCIKQLNTLYKLRGNTNEINTWEQILVSCTEKLNQVRNHYFLQISPIITNIVREILPGLDGIVLIYKRGWTEGLSFIQQLEKDREKNLKYGQLLNGPHKMDIKITINHTDASKVLSRGQKKMLSIVFYLSYLKVLEFNQIFPILCLDDFDAEIDENKLQTTSEYFKSYQSQIFITSVHKEKIVKAFPNADLFHVKHS